MKSAFKEGTMVEVHLLGDKVVTGKVINASAAFVEIFEKEHFRGQSLAMRINYSSILYMYPDIELAERMPPGTLPLRPIPQGPPSAN